MPPILHAYLGPLLALAVSAMGALLCRDKTRQRWLLFVGPIAALVGWAALAPWPGLLREAWQPRGGPELLLLPAVAAIVACAVRSRWTSVALALLVAWWVAQSPLARPEYWRVAAATLALAAWFGRVARGERAFAAGAALAAGLAMAGAPAAWREASLVLAAATAFCPVPAGLLAGAAVAADLGTGRLVRGGFGLADMAGLAALAAPLLAPSVGVRIGKRAGAAGPTAAALAAGLLAAGLGWVLYRALFR